MIQHDLIVFSFLAGLVVGSGGFVLLTLVELAGQELHPETAHTWVFLWLALSFTLVLVLLNLDILVAGWVAVFYVIIVTVGTGVGYVASVRVVGRPWLANLKSL